jgi:Aminotransferase class I and II
MGEIVNIGVSSINCFTGPAFRRSDYDALFDSALDQLRDERRYRDFVDLERLAGQFPHAIWHSPVGPRQVVIWCSNDYLGMAQHPDVVGAMVEAASRMGTGAGGTRNIAGTNHSLIELERELASLHGKEAAWSSPQAMFPTRPASQRSRNCCRTVYCSPMRSITIQ